jgi:hypothetical protein
MALVLEVRPASELMPYRQVKRVDGPSRRPRTPSSKPPRVPVAPRSDLGPERQPGPLEATRRCSRCGYLVIVPALRRAACDHCGARGQ